MDYLSHNISINLRRIRQSKSMSLEQAGRADRREQEHARTDRKGHGKPGPSVCSGKITSGLRIEFQRLIETPREDFCLVKPEALVPTKEIEGSTVSGHAFRMRIPGWSRSTASTSSRAACT